MQMEDSLLAAFRNSSEQCQVIIKSDALREGMQGITFTFIIIQTH